MKIDKRQYVCLLPTKEQRTVLTTVGTNLKEQGLIGKEWYLAMRDAYHSCVCHLEEVLKGEMYVCSLCGKVFPTCDEKELYNHIQMRHPGLYEDLEVAEMIALCYEKRELAL